MLFRPFGPLASVRTQPGFGNDTGYVEFWNEEDATQAEQTMHCSDVDGSNIAVTVYQPRRVSSMSEFSVTAPTFVPTSSMSPYPVSVRIDRCDQDQSLN
jgi:polyadenylate-binding protein